LAQYGLIIFDQRYPVCLSRGQLLSASSPLHLRCCGLNNSPEKCRDRCRHCAGIEAGLRRLRCGKHNAASRYVCDGKDELAAALDLGVKLFDVLLEAHDLLVRARSVSWAYKSNAP
jgi:hypothetical protein